MTIKGFLGFREKFILFAVEGNETDTSMGDMKYPRVRRQIDFLPPPRNVRENHRIREVSCLTSCLQPDHL